LEEESSPDYLVLPVVFFFNLGMFEYCSVNYLEQRLRLPIQEYYYREIKRSIYCQVIKIDKMALRVKLRVPEAINNQLPLPNLPNNSILK